MRELAQPALSQIPLRTKKRESATKQWMVRALIVVMLLPMTSVRSSGQGSNQSKINLHSGDIFQVHMTYDGKKLSWSIKDTRTGATFSTAAPVNIPEAVGGGTAYVGFTGGSGGAGAIQEILTWTFQGESSKIDFGAGFSDKLQVNGNASLAGRRLRLTEGSSGQAGSAFFGTRVSVQSFTNDFSFQLTDAVADGFTFAIQGTSSMVVGGPGEDLGYGGIRRSVAVKFDLWDNAGEGSNSTGLYIDGASPTVPAVDLAPDMYKDTLAHLESVLQLSLPEWRYREDIPHPEDPSVNDTDWPVVKVREEWKTGARVLRRTIEIPEKINGYAVRGARVKLELFLGSNDSMTISIFSNGSLVERADEDTQQPILLTENAQPGQKFVVAVRVSAGDKGTGIYQSRLHLEAAANRPDPNILGEEILAARPMVEAFPDGKTEREEQLAAAVKAIDFTALDRGDQATFDASLEQAQTKLKALDPWLKQFTIRAAGNSHIDMAWLWPWTETVEVVRNTFRSALDLMREYPDFKFTMSSARTYVWMEEKYPDLFKEIEQRVREGRWEVIGGMWVEPDLNMPGGESLVRQILVGKRYFRDKFGVDVKIGWNPDSFGYNWQLPQIYKKSGIDYFVTQKLMWAHEFTTFPYKLFWWESPDGSRILTYFPHDYAGGIDPQQLGTDLSTWVPSIYGTDPKQHSEILHLYGVGDHGGGPTRTMLDNAERWMKPDVVFPNLHFTTAKSFFDDLQPKLSSMKVPTWRDELYFEYHRGVMTTQAETKRRIRASEEVLLNAEKFAAISTLYGRKYPVEDFQRGWRDLLFDDFHDIFPGSGIAVNYLDAKRNLEDVQRVGNEIMNGSLSEIASHIRSNGAGIPVVVFNSMSWPRNEVVEAEVQLPGAAPVVEVVDTSGKVVPSQMIANDAATHRIRLLLKASVPSLGYRTYYVRAAGKSSALPSEIKATNNSLENDVVRLKVDERTGCMTSLFDKRSKSEALAPSETDTGGPTQSVCGNLLQTFRDKPKQWDAWNIDADFEKEHWDLDHADEVKLVENGSLRAVLRVKNLFQNSTFVRDITMTAGSPRVDVHMTADWHEKHILLKVAVPSSAHNDKATFEIPYGSIERPTTRNTPAEKGKFEVPALQWGDLSDSTHGVSLLNDCKYGYDAKGNVLRLSLLRSPEWPDPHADEGLHEFTYSLYPHGGDWRDGMTVRRGYELNYPLWARQIEKHDGELKDESSFVGVDGDNVVLTAMKKAEDEDAVILRYYEWAGKEANVTLRLPAGAQGASETDLMERPLTELTIKNGTVTVHTKPYEIKTVCVRFAPRSKEQAAERSPN
jgi:alpha-mannosidase